MTVTHQIQQVFVKVLGMQPVGLIHLANKQV